MGETILLSTHEAEMKLRDDKIKGLEADNKKLVDLTKNSKELSQAIETKDKEIADLKAEKAQKEKEAQFDELVRSGHLNLAQKEAFMEGNVIKLAQAYEPANIQKTQPKTTKTGEEETVELSAEDRTFCERNGIDLEEYKQIVKFQKEGKKPSYSLDPRLEVNDKK